MKTLSNYRVTAGRTFVHGWRVAAALESQLDEAWSYDKFVTEFGPAGGLSDQQLAALAVYCSANVDQWLPTTIAELLRGKAIDYCSDTDEVDELQPRVIAIAKAVRGR